jgi:hypothetical protein
VEIENTDTIESEDIIENHRRVIKRDDADMTLFLLAAEEQIRPSSPISKGASPTAAQQQR